MTAGRLSDVFGVAIETIALRGVRRFVMAAGAGGDGE